MLRTFSGPLTLLALGLGLVCCESKGSAPGTTAAPGKAAAATGGPAGTIDPGCTAWEDRTDPNGDHPVIEWDPALGKSPSRCRKIKAGQTVTWAGDFTKYPMKPAKGDAPTPIAAVYENISNPGVPGEERIIATFPKPGTFGFACPSALSMKGAILVVP